MRGSRRILTPLVMFILIMAALGAPLSTGQVFPQDYCPAGDQSHSPPDPPGSNADKGHIDLKPGTVDMRFPDTGHVVEHRGVHIVARSGGNAELDVEVKNIGNRNAPATTLKLTLEPPSGSSTTKRVDVGAIDAGTSRIVSAMLPLQTGHHVLTVEVNPDRSPSESCTDSRPNNDCGSITQGCEYTYYNNNKRKVGLITGDLPVLSVQEIHATGPERATHQASPDSEAEITLRVENQGKTAAFNLDGHSDDALPFAARLTIPGCACDAKEVDIKPIPIGGSRIVTTTIPLHSLTDTFTVQVQLDPHKQTGDLDRPRSQKQATFPLPTPQLSAHATSDHATQGRNLLIPEGEPIQFDVHIHNRGDALAATSSGKGVRILIERDQAGKSVLDTRRTIEPGKSVTLQITDSTEDLDEERVYRIRVDPTNEVLESSKEGNERFVVAHVARYEHTLRLDADEPKITVPPGVEALAAFTLENKGTIRDTYRLETHGSLAGDQHYRDMEGKRMDELHLGPGEQARVEFVHKIPASASKGDTFPSSIHVRSKASGDMVVRNLTFIVGDDTVPPNMRLQEPQSGFLNNENERIVIEVTDNVEVVRVETDLYGSFERVHPDNAASNLYTLDATGTPNRFTLTVRATDTSGNEGIQEFTINRDHNPPRIQRFSFTPESGVRPGDLINVILDVYDNNMDHMEIQITQPRPNNTRYMENITLDGTGPRYILRDWRVPERPGHYVFNITATDKAGNEAHEEKRLYVRGLNIEILTIQPHVVPPQPAQGDRVRLTYQIQNSSPHFETGEFFVTLVVDFRRQIGLERINLQPGERRAVVFHWVAEPGPHAFTFVVDQAQEVAEDNPDEDSNLHFTETGILFPDQDLFAPETIRVGTTNQFTSLVVRHWYIPLMLVVTLGMFAAAFVLARRNEQA